MSELFEKDTDTIGLHLRNIFSSGELNEDSTTEESSVVQLEGNRKVKRRIKFYNLDAVISLGYRVNSLRGTQFRIWANKVLRESLVKGYSINHQVLEKKHEQLTELQETIGIIRSLKFMALRKMNHSDLPIRKPLNRLKLYNRLMATVNCSAVKKTILFKVQ